MNAVSSTWVTHDNGKALIKVGVFAVGSLILPSVLCLDRRPQDGRMHFQTTKIIKNFTPCPRAALAFNPVRQSWTAGQQDNPVSRSTDKNQRRRSLVLAFKRLTAVNEIVSPPRISPEFRGRESY